MNETEYNEFVDKLLCKIGLHYYVIEQIYYENSQQLERCIECNKRRIVKYYK